MMEPKSFVKRTLGIAAAILAALLLGAWGLGSARMAASLAAGFAAAAAGFVILAFVVILSFSGRGVKSALIAAVGILKMAVIGGGLWWLLSRGHVEPIALLAGFSTIVVSLLISGVRGG